MALNGKYFHFISLGKRRRNYSFLDWVVTSISSFLGINRKPFIKKSLRSVKPIPIMQLLEYQMVFYVSL